MTGDRAEEGIARGLGRFADRAGRCGRPRGCHRTAIAEVRHAGASPSHENDRPSRLNYTPLALTEGWTGLGKGSGSQDTGKLSRHSADHPLAHPQGRQIDALRLACQRILASVIVPDDDLVVLGNEANDDRFDATSVVRVFGAGSLMPWPTDATLLAELEVFLALIIYTCPQATANRSADGRALPKTTDRSLPRQGSAAL